MAAFVPESSTNCPQQPAHHLEVGQKTPGGLKEPNNNNNNSLSPSKSPNWCCASDYFAIRPNRALISQEFSPMTHNRRSPLYIDSACSKSSRKRQLEELNLFDPDEDAKFLFSPTKLRGVDFSAARNNYPDGISQLNVGRDLNLRPLNIKDYTKGYLQLLSQLTDVGDVSRKQFEDQFSKMQSSESYYTLVIEDESRGKIIGSASLILERKFIHSAGIRGRIEDVVVNTEYRGKQLGKLLVETLTILGKELGCYKMSLECKDKLIPFYESFGYQVDKGNNFLVLRYKD